MMMMREECCALFFENFHSVVVVELFLLRRGVVEKGATNAQVPPSFSFVVLCFGKNKKN